MKGFSKIEKIPVYAKDDIFGVKEPIGYEDYSFFEEHKKSLENWLKMYEDWDIEWSLI